MKSTLRILWTLSTIVSSGMAGGANAPTADNAVGLSPVHVRPLQVSGCVLVGTSFGTLEAGGSLRFRGQDYAVDSSHGSGDRIVYRGPNVKATFYSAHGRPVGEGESGEPIGAAGDVAGVLRVEVAGRVLSVPAREHCIIFE